MNTITIVQSAHGDTVALYTGGVKRWEGPAAGFPLALSEHMGCDYRCSEIAWSTELPEDLDDLEAIEEEGMP